MEKHQAIKIDPSAFKFIAILDIFGTSFIKDEDLFPPAADSFDRIARCDEFLAELPYCSPYAISTGDMKPRRFEYKDKFIQFSSSPTGLPTIRDFDMLIYCVTWIANAAMDGREVDVGPVYQFDVEDFYKFSGRAQNGERESIFIQGLKRLAGSTILSNTKPIGLDAASFNLAEKYQLGRDEAGRLRTVKIRLPHMIYCLTHNEFFDPIHPDYFTLSAARRLIYLFLKQHCGSAERLPVPFAKLHAVTGSASPLRKFHPVIKELVVKPLPEFSSEENGEKENLSFIGMA
ncbi:replication initiator protein A [Devosia sp.]|uniref:replication initiator protein A n=1 Tax=Devosia sp. TaxID=1871048 RepID=UPI0027363062|nr:replication initiator protein A [Devosia sp.]MDP2779604.1 replication initiator protein A [Devosia sp.]